MSLESLLVQQAGVVGLDQAVACGISARTVHRRAADGRWRRLHPRIYLAGGHRITPEVRIRAGALWAGPQAVVTGQAAAHWHGLLARAPAQVELTVPAAAKPRARPGLVLRRRDLDLLDVTTRNGLLVATPAFAALETAGELADGSAFLDRALQRRIEFPDLLDAHLRNAGRPGFAATNAMIAAAADRADSAAERLLMRLLREGGIAGWVTGHPFGPYTLDLAFPARWWPRSAPYSSGIVSPARRTASARCPA